MSPASPVLPDLLRPDLDIVFCGTAPSRRSAAEQAYYAHPGNQFWPALYAAGLIPQPLRASQYPQLLALGIGFTDVAKHHCGTDRELPSDAYDRTGLIRKLTHYRPRIIAFTSKQAARVGMAETQLDYGLQPMLLGPCLVVVLPSPSGQARSHWSLQPWQDLAQLRHQLAQPHLVGA